MNNDLKRLKTDFDQYLSTKPTFTEEDKNQIRKKIGSTKIKKNKYPHFVPNILTAALLIIGLVIGGNLIMNQMQPQDQTLLGLESGADTRGTTDEIINHSEPYTSIELSGPLLNIYEEFALTLDEELLRDLRPYEVFQMFLHALLIEDFETQYAFFIKDTDQIQVFETVGEYVKEMKNLPAESLKTIVDVIENELIEGGKLQETLSDDRRNASIAISTKLGINFQLTKNNDGIWMVNWLPLQ